VAKVLRIFSYDFRAVHDLSGIVSAFDDRTGAIVLTEEALRVDLTALAGAIQAQPPWSDIPFILLLARQTTNSRTSAQATRRLLDLTTNVVVLERPLSARSLMSAVDVALAGRKRQFLLRDKMNELAVAAEVLEARVKERTTALQEEMASRERAEAALRQSQKMEAIGQLTGGIAHDFNNMLQGILGSFSLIQRRMAVGRTGGVSDFLDAGVAAARRAASLTQRLLAYSRRQSLETRAVDVNSLVKSLDDFLRRSLSEKIALKISATATRAAKTDAHQLETAIINLVINARDAMPNGGVITVETADRSFDHNAINSAEPGLYVGIAVSDTGVGMEPAVLERAFDPFFTTKPLGSGTGLGLSMVYGFAVQSGGWAQIKSSPGAGTTVSIFLPVTDTLPELIERPQQAEEHRGLGQRVLVVDDEESVRMIVKEVLTELGYQSIEAAEPYAAMSILTSESKIDLLISDVGLPGMNGRELAENARKHHPDLPVLFITGYAENAAIRSSFLGTNMAMITKPFALEDLSAKIVQMLAHEPPKGPLLH
jgi:signal transduction histidine kinase/ActR/RegA family two-component response regulator